MNTSSKSKTANIALIGVMAAVDCILAPLSIPIGAIPVTLGILAYLLSVYVLGTKRALISFLIYVLLGLAGLPVFSGYQGGPAKLFGPTGGYIFGFIFLILIAGVFIDRSEKLWLHFVGMVLGIAVCYVFGTVWFMLRYSEGITLSKTLQLCVTPFIPFDLAKSILCLIIGPVLRRALKKAGLV